MTPAIQIVIHELCEAGAPQSLILVIEDALQSGNAAAFERALTVAQAWLTYHHLAEDDHETVP